MRSNRFVPFALALFLTAVVPAAAQDTRKFGITMGFPQSIGMIWQSSRVAVRPEVTFSGSSIDSGGGLDSSSWNVGVAVSVLFYLHQYDHLRTYLAPRIDYGRSGSTLNGTVTGTSNTTRWGAGGTGSFGAQYALGDRFSIFGEAGFTFSHSTLPTTLSSVGSGNAWGTRSAVGVVFYP